MAVNSLILNSLNLLSLLAIVSPASSLILRRARSIDLNQSFLIVLDDALTYSGRSYSSEDFSDLGSVEVQDLTSSLFAKNSPKISSPDVLIDKNHLRRILKLTFSTPRYSTDQILAKLAARADVRSVEKDFSLICSVSPNDANYYLQWAPEHIQLNDAWSVQTGLQSIKVGIIDTGIDGNHPDLSASIDSNLSQSWGAYSNPLDDAISHGTHVAGIVGAIGNNSIGVAGVCWNVSLVSYRVDNGNGGLLNSGIASAIISAAANNVPILNFSGNSNAELPAIEQAIEDYGGLFICSAGNNGRNLDSASGSAPSYPASYELNNILVVGNSTSNDLRSSDSNYGAISVDVFAPGTGIYSTVPFTDDGNTGNDYGYKSGTSMASPQVAGLAALLLAEDSTLTATEIKNKILETANPFSNLSGQCVSGGIINAYSAVSSAVHVHLYTDHYEDYTSTLHKAYCRCGQYITETHVYSGYYQLMGPVSTTCLKCGHANDL